ncbi:hypothetical protein [Psychroserpens sp.]|uniref:hypothetical protein n=1 Tax=Psychroserpens sp. TaxID=2020870 RepID=UPI002B26E260|nr:hypothetical protein [Psychroserpens sp.]
MVKKKFNNDNKLTISVSDIPLESNLGLLAYGDIAFVAWRELKKQSKKDLLDEEK